VDESRPIATEANYKWGAALEGYFERGSVAAVGPGFDERKIPGRGDAYRPREDGLWYYQNFGKAIASGKRFLVIETWNELHEASGVGETVEWGRDYIDYTRRLVDEFRNTRRRRRLDSGFAPQALFGWFADGWAGLVLRDREAGD